MRFRRTGRSRKGLGDVGQRSEGEDDKLAGVVAGGGLEVVGSRLRAWRGLGSRKSNAQATGAVEVVGEWELSGQRGFCAPVHGHVGSAQMGHEVECVAGGIFESGVSADCGQGEDVELGGV